MSDLTERLRAHVAECPGAGVTGHGMSHCAECCFGTGLAATSAEEQELMLLCREAADRIEHLETAEFIGRLPDYVKELEADIKRLESALIDIMARESGGCATYVDTYLDRPVNDTCMTTGRTHDAEYGADRTCDACRAADALGLADRADRRAVIESRDGTLRIDDAEFRRFLNGKEPKP